MKLKKKEFHKNILTSLIHLKLQASYLVEPSQFHLVLESLLKSACSA